jgi:histidyl-tRNA synthetase
MGQTKARTLKGFRDYLPEVEIPRTRMLRRVVRVFESFGFSPLATPAIEYADILLGKSGDEGDKLLYRFEDNGGRDVALRYDLTVPLARVVGQYGNLDKPFKRYQIAPVWRAEKPARGRFREFVQCDVDIVGEASVRADAECMMVGLEVLKACEVPKYEMRVNHRGILHGMLDRAGIEDASQRMTSLRALDKLDKMGKEKVVAELKDAVGLDASAIASLFEVVERPIRNLNELRQLQAFFGVHERGSQGAESLLELVTILEEAGYADQVRVDLSIARGLDYYTGTVYETFIVGHEEYGSVMSGGRYDEMIGLYAKQGQPAVGICLGVDRLISALQDMGLLSEDTGTADVYVTLFEEADFGHNAGFARKLREVGLSVEMSMSAKKLGKQFKAAERKGCRFVVMIGDDERAQEVVQIKDMATGEQESVKTLDAPNWLTERVLGT